MKPLLFTAALVLTLSASAQTPAPLPEPVIETLVGTHMCPELGHSVAVDGAYTVAGAPFDSSRGKKSGAVKVFDSRAGALLFVLLNPEPSVGDGFGMSVAISGTRVVVGAPYERTGVNNYGRAYVYDLRNIIPTVPIAILNNPIPETNKSFCDSVAISGTRVVIGAESDDTGARDAGSAYVYDLTSGTPTVPVAKLNNPNPEEFDLFGGSVAISGTRVVVGAYWENAGAIDSGSAYVYDLSSGTPTVPVVTLNNPNPAMHANFGNSVAISGTRVVVGTYLDDTGATDAGSVYVYDLSSGTPTVPVITLHNPSPFAEDYFGRSVAISGTRVVVGAALDDTGVNDAGSVYVYDLGSSAPSVPVVTLRNPIPTEVGCFGWSVAISGIRVVVGEPYEDTGAEDNGSAYIYDLTSGTPTVPVATLHNTAQP